MVFEKVSYVLQGKIRVAVLRRLVQKPGTPTVLSKEFKTHQSTVSRAIQDLEREGILECITPKARHYRFYKPTDKGKKILKEVEQVLKTEKK